MNYAFKEVKDNLTPNMVIWWRRFNKAARCKELAYQIAGYSCDPVIIAKYDKRMDFVWSKVKEVEPFATFINGELSDKAAYYLNGITILKATKQI